MMLSKRKALVTGASRGIGYSIAKELLNQGYEVIGTSRSLHSLKIENSSFTPLKLDLEQITRNQDVLKKLTDHCSDIDVLIVNAGIGRFGSLEEFSHSQIEQSLTINLISQIQLVRAFIPLFKRRELGDIIFIGSESALTAGKQGTVYSAAKFGLRGFSQALRRECANNNIRVGLINPGMVDTDFFADLSFEPGSDKANRILPEQVAQAVMLMLNSGQNVVFDEMNLSPLKKAIFKKNR